MTQDVLPGPSGPLVSMTNGPKDQIIELTVNKAAVLYELPNPKPHQIARLCELKDLDHESSSLNAQLKDFESQVFLNYEVEWIAQTTDEDYRVVIDSISYKFDFFKSTSIANPKGGQLKVRVRDDGNLIGKQYDYQIKFSIYKSNMDPKTFIIDPKLCANN